MRLKTKLVLAATGAVFAIVLVLSSLFLTELLKQRIAQTAANNEVMARQVLMMARQAVQVGLTLRPPTEPTDEALAAATKDALLSYAALNDTMNSYVRYSPSVQDVSVTDAHGLTLTSTDPQMLNQQATARMSFDRVRDGQVLFQVRQLFGRAHVLDVSAPLDRNGKTFLVVHIGLTSTFLENSYVPWLKDAFFVALAAALISMLAAGLLASVALRPIEEISRQLERLTGAEEAEEEGKTDAVVRVTNRIDRLGQQIRTTEAGYTDLRANLNQVLDTLREGVVLFTAERRAAMVSDAVAKFLAGGAPVAHAAMTGRPMEEIFAPGTELGRAVLAGFERGEKLTAERVRLEDGREVEITLAQIEDGRGAMGTLLTLRDAGSALRLEQELEVSRRLAAIGRLTAGVGHEVKNPINAMVVHLELLKSKLAAAGETATFPAGAQRHVDILAGEMERLDRVVQTLADFTRPMELHLREMDLRDVVESVIDLTGAEMAEHRVEVRCELESLQVRADGELLRQAMLNLMLNAMQAMPDGGILEISARRDGEAAVLVVRDEGIGIAAELMPRIFELYFTTKAKGSGIGLAMTYRIVQMHGGSMEVASETGKGSSFTVRLPVAVAVGGDARQMAGRAA